MEPILKQIMMEIEKLQPRYGTHGFEHTMRVYEMCIQIGTKIGANMKVLLPAALLHDISRGLDNHAEIGAEKVKPILKKYGYAENKIQAISDIIYTHSFSGDRSPTSLEGKILSDADKLDAMGALGIYRTGTYSGEHARSIEDFVAHFHNKLLDLEKYLYTEDAKKLAKGRKEFMLRYLEQLSMELLQVS